MKKLLGIVVLGLLWCTSALAESRLPKCQGNDHTKWINCFGKYDDPKKIKGATKTYEGEFGNTPGVLHGAGSYYFTKNGIVVAKYEGELNNGKDARFSIQTHKNIKKLNEELIIITLFDHNQNEGNGFRKILFPEGDMIIGRIKNNKHNGYALQTTKIKGFERKKQSEVYGIFKNGVWVDNIPIEDINKFEEQVLVFETQLLARKDCQEINIKPTSKHFDKCYEKFLKFHIKKLNDDRLVKISNFDKISHNNKKIYRNEDGEITECTSFTASGACAYRIPYEIKSKKYSNNKYDPSELIELGLILTGNNNNYSNSQPRLFYDNLSGRMLECAGKVTIGRCNNFKPYNTKSYDYNTLFFNAAYGTMQRCLNPVMGKCNKFRPQPIIQTLLNIILIYYQDFE